MRGSLPPVRALIAEDEPLLRNELRETLRSVWPELTIVAEAADGVEAIAAFDRHAPQILFLDIDMPGHSGLEIARHVSGRAHIVFITAYNQYAVAAFEQGALDYVLKPISTARLEQTVARLKTRLGSVAADLGGLLAELRDKLAGRERYLQWISVEQGQELRLITVGEICYFRSDEKYTAVVTAESEYLVSRPLKALAEELDPTVFWRIHRGVIVNANAIRSVHRDFRGRLEVRLKTRSETLPVSSGYAQQFRKM